MARRKPEIRTYLSNISLSPTSAHYYYTPVDGWNRTHRHTANQVNLEENKHNGVISYKGRKRLESSLNWLLYYSKAKIVRDGITGKKFIFKINMITLTLPATQKHSDQEITKRCLKNFIDVLRQKVNLENYVWRAESQANGNIHYHVITDKYVHYNDVRKWWNQSIELLGYVSEYQKKFHHSNPNSTDVHSIKHTKRLASYLSKYISKNRAFTCIGDLRLIKGETVEVLYNSQQYQSETGNKKKGKVIGHVLGARIRTIESKLWACSQSLSKCKSIQISEDMLEYDEVDKAIGEIEHRLYQGEFVCSVYGDFSQVIKKLQSEQLASLAVQQPV